MIQLTDIRIKPKENHTGIYATVTIVLNHNFCIRGIRIVKGKKGAFIGMPCHWDPNKEEPIDHCYPLNQMTRDYITEEIMKAFVKEYPEIAKDIQMYSPKNVNKKMKQVEQKTQFN